MAWAPGTVNGPHQGAWVTDTAGDDWFVHFQDKGAYGRIVHLQPMAWRADGWPVIGEDPDGDGVGQPVSTWTVPASATGSAAAAASCVNKEAPACPTAAVPLPYGLPLEWQFPTIPSAYWSMALPDGGVRLYSVEKAGPGLWDCPNLLLRKFPAEKFTVTACLAFRPNPSLKGEQAGFVVMGNDYAGLRMTDTEEGARLEYVTCLKADKGGEEQGEILSMLPYRHEELPHGRESRNVPLVHYPDVPEVSIWVKLEVVPRPVEGNVPEAVCTFSWSIDGKKYVSVNGKQPFTAKPEMWIGAKFGFWCNRRTPKNDSGWLDIRQLSVSY